MSPTTDVDDDGKSAVASSGGPEQDLQNAETGSGRAAVCKTPSVNHAVQAGAGCR